MAASGSGGEPVRPWTATSTWAPAGGGAVEDAVSFETSDEDAEASPAGVVLSRPLPDGDSDAPPCEVTVCFRGKYEIHRVYMRSTARIYEIYHSTDTKVSSKDYLCTVRCGLAVKEPQPCGEESMAQWSSGTSTSENREQEAKSVSSSSDEDSWVDVKIPECPMGNNTTASQERNVVGTYQENTLAHYEATAEMTDVSPCVSLTVRLLSLQSKTSVHIEEIYIFADPVESTDDNSATGPGSMAASSLLAMFVPGLMQMSKSRSLKIDDGYFSHGSRSPDCAVKESSPFERIAQEAGSCSTDDSKYKPAAIESGINPTDGGTVSKEKCSQSEFQFKDPKSFSLSVQTTENTQVPSVTDQRVSNTDQLAHPLMNGIFTPYNHIERKLDTLLSKVEKIELYCSRFEDSMVKPLGSIEARLQRLEQQFDSFSVEIQSLRCSSARTPAPDGQSDTTNSREKAYNVGDTRTTASITDRLPGLAVRAPDFSSEDSSYNVTGPGPAVRAPDFTSEGSCCYNATDENQVNFRGSNMVPTLLVKVPDFICQPQLTCEKLHSGSSSPVAFSVSSGKERKTSPGLVVKVPEFPDDDDDDEVEEEKEAEVGDHDDSHTQYDDTLGKSTVDSSKSKNPVSINGALASALEALLTSTRGTSSSNSVICTASNLSAENTNDSLGCSLSPEKVDEMSTKDGSADKFPGTFGDAILVGTVISSQEIDAAPHTSLSNTILGGKVELMEQNNDPNSGKVAFIASTESLDVPSQPHAVEEYIDDVSRVNGQNSGSNLDTMPSVASTGPFYPPQPPTVVGSVVSGAPVSESRPAVSLAEFLASRNASSCKNGNSEVCGCNDGAEILSSERTSAGAGKNSKNISQLLVKKALEVVANDRRPFSSVPIGENFEGPSYTATRNAANGHDINTIKTMLDKDCGLSAFFQCSASDSKKKWTYDSSLDWSQDGSSAEPNAEHSWSNLSCTESFSEATANEPVALATTTSGKYVEDILADIGISSTVSPIAEEELQKVCDLLYEYKADMLDIASTAKRTSKSSPSLEVLLGESSDSEAQVSDLDGIENGFGSPQVFSSFSSSDGDVSAADRPLVDVADLSTPCELYASSALNEPLVDVADLTNHSGTYDPAMDGPLADAFDLPNTSETNASGLNEPLVNGEGMPKPLETVSGGSSGEYPDSLI